MKIVGILLIVAILNGSMSFISSGQIGNRSFGKSGIHASGFPENNELSYSLRLPYTPSTVLSDKVEQIVITQNPAYEKIHFYYTSAGRKITGILRLAQYTQVLLISRQVKTTAVYFCKLQI